MVSYDETIPPGLAGRLEVELNTDNLYGNVRKSITVESNDPDRPKVFLTVRAVVLTSVLVLPDWRVALGNYAPGAEVGRVLIRKEPTEQGELRIADVETSVPWLEARATRLDAPRPSSHGLEPGRPGDWLLEVHVAGPPEYGRKAAKVRFKTHLTRQPEVELHVVTTMLPPVDLSTERLVLPRRNVVSARPHFVIVGVREDLDPETLRIEPHPETMAVELEPVGGRHYKVHVKWQADDGAEGKLDFQVGEEHYELAVAIDGG